MVAGGGTGACDGAMTGFGGRTVDGVDGVDGADVHATGGRWTAGAVHGRRVRVSQHTRSVW